MSKRLLLIPLLFPAACAEVPPPYNLVIVSVDTLRADHLGTYGYERATSPAIDALARRGVVFERAYSQANMTAPSHMTIFTGLLPEAHGVWNLETEENHGLSEDLPTLATILSGNGFRTRAITDGGNVSGALGFARGFEQYEEPEPGRIGDVRTVFARGRETLREWKDEQFFLFLHTYEVHDPYVPPRQFRERFTDPDYAGAIRADREQLLAELGDDWLAVHKTFWNAVDRDSQADVDHIADLYDASIAYTDGEFGGFIDELDALGLDQRTIVVFLSDHGEELADHGGFMHYTMYQENLHVPLIFVLPSGRFGNVRGSRVPQVVRLLDVAPTVLDLLEIPAPEHMQGRPLLRGELENQAVFSMWPREHLYALRVGDWKLIEARAGAEARHFKQPETKLFNLAADPRETQDLLARHELEAGELSLQLESIRQHARSLRAAVAAGAPIELDEALRAQLSALGYLGNDE